jgi:hypothetical protein
MQRGGIVTPHFPTSGVRLEKRLVKSLKAVAELHDLSLGEPGGCCLSVVAWSSTRSFRIVHAIRVGLVVGSGRLKLDVKRSLRRSIDEVVRRQIVNEIAGATRSETRVYEGSYWNRKELVGTSIFVMIRTGHNNLETSIACRKKQH